MKIMNLTPHTVTIAGEVFPPSGQIACLEETEELITHFGNLPVYMVLEGEVTGLPELDGDTVYIVSRPVAQAVRVPSVVIPHRFIHDRNGQIIGAEGLGWFGLREED